MVPAAFGMYSVKILKIISETNDAKTFTLECLDGWTPIYEAGQFITLVFFTKHGEKRRSYSISSSPLLGEPLSITVKKVANGEFSRQLIDTSREGDILYSSGISGLFVLPVNADIASLYCFVAAGSGITPCVSMIKTILAKFNAKIFLIYSNRSQPDTIFHEALQLLQLENPSRFHIKFLYSNVFDVYKSRLGKWLLEQLLEENVGNEIDKTLFYLCGPFEYMRMIEITLAGKVEAGQIRKENFNSLPRMFTPRPPDTDPHTVTLLNAGEQFSFKVQYPDSILSAAKKLKISLPYSCEAGRCGSCVALCSSGRVWMAYNEVLTDEEVEKGLILTCQAYPVAADVSIVF